MHLFWIRLFEYQVFLELFHLCSNNFHSNFEMVTSPTYGSCFSINSNLSGNAASLWKSSLSGPNLGLQMELNLDQKEYMSNGLTRSAGARLYKHLETH